MLRKLTGKKWLERRCAGPSLWNAAGFACGGFRGMISVKIDCGVRTWLRASV
jgi:hypothetical protein